MAFPRLAAPFSYDLSLNHLRADYVLENLQ